MTPRAGNLTEGESFVIIFFIIGGVGLSPYVSAQVPRYCGHFGLLYKPQMIDEDDF
jgi:hypothetical protein